MQCAEEIHHEEASLLLTQLKPEADVDAYDLSPEVDHPRSQELLPISYYRATRVEGKAIGEGNSLERHGR